MKILHVVTHLSRDGAFGGPTRVALSQAKALAARGHDVTVFAGSPADEAGSIRQDGYQIKTFPTSKVVPFGGFATLLPRGMLSAVWRTARQFDVCHVHLARDLATLPAATIMATLRVPFVVQTHGMVAPPTRALARVLDTVATRQALRAASCWLVLTSDEDRGLRQLATPKSVTSIRNGIELRETTPLAGRPDVILYLARLHPRKRPLTFVEVAAALYHRLPGTNFLIIGPDEGEGPAVLKAISDTGMSDRIRWLGPLPPSETDRMMASARVYVLPSVNEVFPMSILEAFAAGTPVVATDSLGIADDSTKFGAALITDGSVPELADATLRAHSDADLAAALRSGAQSYLRHELNIDDVALQLQRVYQDALPSSATNNLKK